MSTYENKKILFIADHLKGGGAERILLDLATCMQHKGISISIALLDSQDIRMSIPKDIQQFNIDVNHQFFKGRLWKKRLHLLQNIEIEKISNVINIINPDIIVLTHWYAYHIYPILPKNITTWLWIHGKIFNPNKQETKNIFRWYKEIRRLYLDRAFFPKFMNNKNLITVNDEVRKLYQPYIPNSKIVTIPNGIDKTRLLNTSLKNTTIEKKWDCIFVGRLGVEKQPQHAITAFAHSQLTGRMAIVGDGTMLDQLQQLCSTLAVSDRIDFLGWQTNPSIFIQQSHLLILSSKTEGSPLTIAESIIIGTPVVAYNVSSGVEWQLSSNHLTQGLVSNQNIAALTDTINQVYYSPYPILQEDKNRLSIENMANKFINLFEMNSSS